VEFAREILDELDVPGPDGGERAVWVEAFKRGLVPEVA
jgi:hypothetical protein